MTTLTTLTTRATPAALTGTAAGDRTLVDAPLDLRCPAAGSRRSPHRFPAATYLCRAVAREERSMAAQALEATDRQASRHVGALALTASAVFAAILVLVGTGRSESGPGVTALALLAGGLVLVVVALVVVLRRSEREHDVLAQRVRMYDARLQQLRARR